VPPLDAVVDDDVRDDQAPALAHHVQRERPRLGAAAPRRAA
jgi:hypothetical protein